MNDDGGERRTRGADPDRLIDVHTGAAEFRRDVGGGVRWLGTAQVIAQCTRIAMILVLTRLLTPQEFGIVALVMVVTGLFDRVLGDTGTSAALVRQPELKHGLASSVLWWNLMVGAGTAAFFALLGGPIATLLGDSAAAPLVRVVGLSALISGFGHVQRALLRRTRAFRSLALVNVTNAAATAVATIALALAGWGEWALVVGNLVGTAASVALAWALSDWRPSFHYSRAALGEITQFSANLSAQNLFGYVSYAGDRFIIGRFIGTTSLGYYGLANRLLRYPLQTSAQTYREVVFPTLAQVQDDPGALQKAYGRTVNGIAFILLPLCLSVAALSEPLVAALLGPNWTPATDVVRVMALVAALQSMTTTTGSLYLVRGRTDLSLRWQMASSAVLLACYSIGALWGLMGVAWGYFVGIALLTYPAFRIPLRLIDTTPGAILRPTLPTALTAAVAAACGWGAAEIAAGAGAGDWLALGAGGLTVVVIYGFYAVVVRPTAVRDLRGAISGRQRRSAVDERP